MEAIALSVRLPELGYTPLSLVFRTREPAVKLELRSEAGDVVIALQERAPTPGPRTPTDGPLPPAR